MTEDDFEMLVTDEDVEYTENGLPKSLAYKNPDGEVREATLIDEEQGIYLVNEFGETYNPDGLDKGAHVQVLEDDQEQLDAGLDEVYEELDETFEERQVTEEDRETIDYDDRLDGIMERTEEEEDEASGDSVESLMDSDLDPV